MPLFFGLAVTFWSGLQREWPCLSAAEREAARDYIRHNSAKPMPVHLYQRLLGMSVAGARETQAWDDAQGASAAIVVKLVSPTGCARRCHCRAERYPGYPGRDSLARRLLGVASDRTGRRAISDGPSAQLLAVT
jgi:hypothetical protein